MTPTDRAIIQALSGRIYLALATAVDWLGTPAEEFAVAVRLEDGRFVIRSRVKMQEELPLQVPVQEQLAPLQRPAAPRHFWLVAVGDAIEVEEVEIVGDRQRLFVGLGGYGARQEART